MSPVNESGRIYDSDEGGEDLFDSIVPSNPPLCFSPISILEHEQPSSPGNNVEEEVEEHQLENQTCDNDKTDDYGIPPWFFEENLPIPTERSQEKLQAEHDSIPESTNPQPISSRPNDLSQTAQPQSSSKTSAAAAATQILPDISHPVSLEEAIAIFCPDANSQEDPYSKDMEEILEKQYDCQRSQLQNFANPAPIQIESTSHQPIEYQQEINMHFGPSFQTYRRDQVAPDHSPRSQDRDILNAAMEEWQLPLPVPLHSPFAPNDDHPLPEDSDSELEPYSVPEPDPEPEPEQEPQNLVHITNQPNSEDRMRYRSEGGNYPKLKGKNGEPVSLTIKNPDTKGRWKAIICCIENHANSNPNSKPILHSNGLHFCGQDKNNFQGIVCVSFVLNEKNGCLEMKTEKVATHKLKNNNEAPDGLEKARDALERHGLSDLVELPNLDRYKSPDEFRLLFFIMKNDGYFNQVISEPILNAKSKRNASGRFKIDACLQKEISMTNPQEIAVLLNFPDFLRNSNDRITAQFSYKNSEMLHPEITLEKVNGGSGKFTPNPFPTPHPTEEVKVRLPAK